MNKLIVAFFVSVFGSATLLAQSGTRPVAAPAQAMG
jgi:hypothetical protein